MKTAFMMFARNKAKHVEMTIESILKQTYSPMEILLSDQGSTDGTLEIIKRCAAGYNGPNLVRVLECPDTEQKGMAGLNAHVNWINRQTDADIIIATAADDVAHPERAAETVKIFERYDPFVVSTAMYFMDSPEASDIGSTAYQGEGFVGWHDCSELLVGGSSSIAWRREFYDSVGPLDGPCILQDLYLPFMAAAMGKYYFCKAPLHAYIRHADPENTGQEGILRAAEAANDEAEKKRIRETIAFQLAANSLATLRKCDEVIPHFATDKQIAGHPMHELHSYLVNKFFNQAMWFIDERTKLTMERIQPKALAA
jgi:hypothetical protein